MKGKERHSSQNTKTRHNAHLQGQDRTNGRGHAKIKAVDPLRRDDDLEESIFKHEGQGWCKERAGKQGEGQHTARRLKRQRCDVISCSI